MWKHTYLFFKRLTSIDSITFGIVAKVCGKTEQTAQAWGRAPASPENPLGTGYQTPLDCVLRLLSLAHKEDAGLAHEAAEMFPEFVKHLDELSGKTFVRKGGDSRQLLAAALSENTDILVAMSQKENVDWELVKAEFYQFESAFHQFKACLLEEMKTKAGEVKSQ